MKGQNARSKRRSRGRNDPSGFSLLELLIVVAVIGIGAAYATIQISNAQQSMRLSSSTRQLTSYMEKARIDSIRRHAMTSAQMANISITGLRSYTITTDFDSDGVVETRALDLPQNRGVSFNTGSTPLPIKITYDWRGRPTVVDGNGTAITAGFSLQDVSGRSSTINVTGSGDIGITGYDATSNANVTQPTISTVNTNANVKTDTRLP